MSDKPHVGPPRPMVDLIKDRAFLEHLAPYLGMSPRTVRKHLAAVAARGYFAGQMSNWTPEECPCAECHKGDYQ